MKSCEIRLNPVKSIQNETGSSFGKFLLLNLCVYYVTILRLVYINDKITRFNFTKLSQRDPVLERVEALEGLVISYGHLWNGTQP